VRLPLKHSKAFAWAGHLETIKSMGILQLDVLSEIRDFDIPNTNSFSTIALGNNPKCPFSVSVGLLT
jgi:hypothetical protein